QWSYQAIFVPSDRYWPASHGDCCHYCQPRYNRNNNPMVPGSSFAGKVKEEAGKVHIRVIAPVLDSPGLVGKAKLEYEAIAAPGTTISVVPVARGTNT